MILCVDLDGPIAQGASNWPDYTNCLPVPGIKDVLAKLAKAGWSITIWTARMWDDFEVTKNWLVRHGIPYHTLVMGKPWADVYIDDKALRFEGDWEGLCKQLRQLSRE